MKSKNARVHMNLDIFTNLENYLKTKNAQILSLTED